MANGHILIIENKDGIGARAVGAALAFGSRGLYAGNEDAANFIFAGAVQRARFFDGGRVVVPGRIVADRHNVGFKARHRKSDRRIKRVGDDGGAIALA